MYRATYAVSAHRNKQWSFQCHKQFLCFPFISRRRHLFACSNGLKSLKNKDLICNTAHRGIPGCVAWPCSNMALNSSEPNCTGKAGTWHFPALHLISPGTLGSPATLLQSDKLNGNLPYSTLIVSARNQVLSHIKLKNLPGLPRSTKPGTESSSLASVPYHRPNKSWGQGAEFPHKQLRLPTSSHKLAESLLLYKIQNILPRLSNP